MLSKILHQLVKWQLLATPSSKTSGLRAPIALLREDRSSSSSGLIQGAKDFGSSNTNTTVATSKLMPCLATPHFRVIRFFVSTSKKVNGDERKKCTLRGHYFCVYCTRVVVYRVHPGRHECRLLPFSSSSPSSSSSSPVAWHVLDTHACCTPLPLLLVSPLTPDQ